MERTLVINPGSSSKKYAVYAGAHTVASFVFEETHDGYEQCLEVNGIRQRCEEATRGTYESSLEEVLTRSKEECIIEKNEDITRAVVRVVAPGTFFQEHRAIDEYYMAELERKHSAAPLHIPVVLDEIVQFKKLLPHVELIAASDSAFHKTIPAHARIYGIPSDDAASFDIYRFGYHGLSIESVVPNVERLLGSVPEHMVVAHIGSGVSIAALKDGRSIETSMGFSPASGLMMGTRAGDIDPGALIYLLEQKGLSGDGAHTYIEQVSGFRGLLGTSDLRVVLDRANKNDPKATDVVRAFFSEVRGHIGARIATLGALDTLVLTATAPERNPLVRSLVCDGLDVFGITLDRAKNDACIGQDSVISVQDSPTRVLVVRTHEMNVMASIKPTSV
jgi:acetate kinase